MSEPALPDVDAPGSRRPPAERTEPPGGAPPVRSALFSLLLSLVVVLAIAHFTFDLEQFRETALRLNPWYLAAAVASVATRVGFGAWRLRYVSRGTLHGHAAVRGQLAWDFLSNITPSAIGGGPVAAIYIARDLRIPVGEATAIMLFAMLLDQFLFAMLIPVILALSFFVPVFPTSMGAVGSGAFVVVFLGLMAWVALFGYAVLIRPDLLQRLADGVLRVRGLRRFRERVAAEMVQMRERTTVLRSQPASFYVNGVLLTAGGWAARFVGPLLVVRSVYADFDAFLLVLRTAAMSIATIVLPTPGGSGGVEGLYVLFIGPLIPWALVAPTLLTWRFLSQYVFLFVGVYLSMRHVQVTIRRKNRREDAGAPEAPSLPGGRRGGSAPGREPSTPERPERHG